MKFLSLSGNIIASGLNLQGAQGTLQNITGTLFHGLERQILGMFIECLSQSLTKNFCKALQIGNCELNKMKQLCIHFS